MKRMGAYLITHSAVSRLHGWPRYSRCRGLSRLVWARLGSRGWSNLAIWSSKAPPGARFGEKRASFDQFWSPFSEKGYPFCPKGYPPDGNGYPLAPSGYPFLRAGYPAGPTGYPIGSAEYPFRPTGYAFVREGHPFEEKGTRFPREGTLSAPASTRPRGGNTFLHRKGTLGTDEETGSMKRKTRSAPDSLLTRAGCPAASSRRVR